MQAPAYRLTARIGGHEYSAQLRESALLIGSAPEAGFVLPDPTVSRRHARIESREGGLWIEDLGSRNGTRVAGVRVQQARELPLGAALKLGEVDLRVELLSADDAELAVPAVAGPSERHMTQAEQTLVSAGLTRFCVREIEPLLERLACGTDLSDYPAAVLRALVSAQPDAGFVLYRRAGNDAAILARAGEAGAGQTQLRRGALELCIRHEGAEAQPALRTLGGLGLALIETASRPLATVKPATPDTAPPPAPDTASKPLREIYWQAARVARSRLNVLITGESGTGKELLARYIHEASGEPADRFGVLNCAALPPDLLDAELFGIEAGVATGVQARPGRFELAHGGTLFLDEIGDMAPDTQSRILRVLQQREVYRVGSHKPRPADVRVVSATHRDLEAMVHDGGFRLDLLHRIADWRAELPPLRHRREDIANLAAGFLVRACSERGAQCGGISRGALDALSRYRWPGNVRELEREMLRIALFLGDGEPLLSTLLKPEILAARHADEEATTLAAQLEREERRIIVQALARCRGQVSDAAEQLGVSKSTLYRRIAQLGLGDDALSSS